MLWRAHCAGSQEWCCSWTTGKKLCWENLGRNLDLPLSQQCGVFPRAIVPLAYRDLMWWLVLWWVWEKPGERSLGLTTHLLCSFVQDGFLSHSLDTNFDPTAACLTFLLVIHTDDGHWRKLLIRPVSCSLLSNFFNMTAFKKCSWEFKSLKELNVAPVISPLK